MNKFIFTICTLCMLCISCTSSAQVNYTIKGTANGMNGTTVYLSLLAGELNRTVIDSCTINNNSFTFKGSQPKICFASISVGKYWGKRLILENGIIKVIIIIDKEIKITGTPTNDILNSCNEKINAFQNELWTLGNKIYYLKENQKDEKAALQKKRDEFFEKKLAVARKCLNQNLDNIVGAYLLNQPWIECTMSDEEFDKILADASPVMKESDFFKEVVERREGVKRTAIGQKYTDFKMKDLNDKEIALSDYIGKGKYVLLDFWASWCGPCRREMPNVKAAYEKFRSKGFEIVGVSLDDKKEDWLKGIEDLGIIWPQMSDLKGWKCEIVKLYGIRGIPSTFLIDPNGIIIAIDLRGEAIEKKLSELLK